MNRPLTPTLSPDGGEGGVSPGEGEPGSRPQCAPIPGGRSSPWLRYVVPGVVCALVIGIFAWSAQPGILETVSEGVENSYYNLLVEGFGAGQLSMNREPDPGLGGLADPYDPALNASYVWQSHHLAYEMSYYKGKLYLYFGVTPAVVLFWPYHVLTGHYLSATEGVVIFFALGFLAAAWLVDSIRRRYFPETSGWVMALCLLALGLGTGTLEILSSCDVYEITKSCAFMFTMLALGGIWRAMVEPERRLHWLLLASLAYGLAIGARPTLLYGAIILLIPVAQAWRSSPGGFSRSRLAGLLLAASGPLAVIGAGLMLYNYRRFDNPLEFGWHYQMTDINQHTGRQFSLRYLWHNFRFYFLEPLRWSGGFPFLQANPLPPAPPGYGGIGAAFSGILPDYPVVWLALAAPLAWTKGMGRTASALRGFAVAVFLLFAICAFTICLFLNASSRYQFDFLPTLMLLAVLGIFGLERALADSTVWRRIARGAWGLLLADTLLFNALAGVEARAAAEFFIGNAYFNRGDLPTSIRYFQKALALQPNHAGAHYCLGNALLGEGKTDEAIAQYQKAVELEPNNGDAHYFLALCYFHKNKLKDAMVEGQRAYELKPDNGVYYNLLADILLRKRQFSQAIIAYRKTLQINPDNAQAHNNLALALLMNGQTNEALAQYQEAVKYDPNNASYDFNLGDAYRRKQMAADAMACYQKAIAVDPQSAPARASLAWMLATWPDPSIRDGRKALALAQEANQITGGSLPQVLRALAAAYAETGDYADAVLAAKEALARTPSRAASDYKQELQAEIRLYQANSPCRARDY